MTLESSFGYLLTQALMDSCDIGQYAYRRLDDLLFHEYDLAGDGEFSHWLQKAMYADYQPGAAKHDEAVPPHSSLVWPALIIQAAIHSREPERIAQILADEIDDYTLGHIAENDWVDLDGNPSPLNADEIQNDQRAVMSWPANWRRMFGTKRRAA
jgi:hypothetical protein